MKIKLLKLTVFLSSKLADLAYFVKGKASNHLIKQMARAKRYGFNINEF